MTAQADPGADGAAEDTPTSFLADGPLPRDPPPPPGWEDPFEGSAVLHDLRTPSDDPAARSGDARPDPG